MEVKTYIADNVSNALKKAKDELGENIVLLESKEFDNNNRYAKNGQISKIKVAVYNNEKANVQKWNPRRISTKPNLKEVSDKPKNEFNDVLSDILKRKPQDRVHEKQILKELSELRQELNELSRKSDDASSKDFPKRYANVYNDLKDKGVDKNIAYKFVKRSYLNLEGRHNISQEAIETGVKSEMKQMLTTYKFKNGALRGNQQVIMLIGSTGVGKSTTAMKLATHKDLFGKKDAAIISADPFGPTVALKSYENITGKTVVEAKSAEEIKTALQSLKDKEVVIIDTPGRSPFTPNYIQNLEEYLEIINPTDIFLVLSMSADTRDIFLACGLYLLLKPTGFVFTKFDETTQPGKVFTIVNEIGLPVVCFCEGERIFIDVEVGKVEYMYDKIFEAN